jgi:hypothetical protein
MSRLLAATIAVLTLSGCATFGTGETTKAEPGAPYAGYIAINPISLPPDLFNDTVPKSAETSTPKAGGAPATQPTATTNPNLKFLINNAARVSIQEVSNSGEVKYIASGLSRKNTYYHATIDYIKYHSSSINLPVERKVSNPTTTAPNPIVKVILGVAVGVGLRAEASFFSTENGAKIADIVNIGASAQTSQISGTMAFQTMGIESKAISDALPIPSQLSSSSVQNALQTMATVKANIYATETNVVPQIVGIEIQSYPDGVDLADVIRALHSEKKYLIDQVIEELNQRKVKFYGFKG